ncbi:putative LOC100569746 [Trichonephila clavipes]|nr:putative LOC100569746 [Trichonephila clavipes]
MSVEWVPTCFPDLNLIEYMSDAYRYDGIIPRTLNTLYKIDLSGINVVIVNRSGNGVAAGEGVLSVLLLAKILSVITVHHEFRRKYHKYVPTSRATIDLLEDTFGDRLISRFGPVNWPPRSWDLTPLDYFLWGYVKSLVYADKPQTLDHLEDNIRRVIADIRQTNVGKSNRKLDVQIGLHPSQPWQSYARNHI